MLELHPDKVLQQQRGRPRDPKQVHDAFCSLADAYELLMKQFAQEGGGPRPAEGGDISALQDPDDPHLLGTLRVLAEHIQDGLEPVGVVNDLTIIQALAFLKVVEPRTAPPEKINKGSRTSFRFYETGILVSVTYNAFSITTGLLPTYEAAGQAHALLLKLQQAAQRRLGNQKREASRDPDPLLQAELDATWEESPLLDLNLKFRSFGTSGTGRWQTPFTQSLRLALQHRDHAKSGRCWEGAKDEVEQDKASRQERKAAMLSAARARLQMLATSQNARNSELSEECRQVANLRIQLNLVGSESLDDFLRLFGRLPPAQQALRLAALTAPVQAEPLPPPHRRQALEERPAWNHGLPQGRALPPQEPRSPLLHLTLLKLAVAARFLDLQPLDRLRRASVGAHLLVANELAVRMAEGVSALGIARHTKWRCIVDKVGVRERRVEGVLRRPTLYASFRVVNLSGLAISAFPVSALLSFLVQMGNLKEIKVPSCGWACKAELRAFRRGLPRGVKITLVA